MNYQKPFYDVLLEKNKEIVASYQKSEAFNEYVTNLSNSIDKDMLIMLAHELKTKIKYDNMTRNMEASAIRTLFTFILAIKEIEKNNENTIKTIK